MSHHQWRHVRPGSKHLVGLAKVLQVDVAALLSNL